jgi:hypothetical protein
LSSRHGTLHPWQKAKRAAFKTGLDETFEFYRFKLKSNRAQTRVQKCGANGGMMFKQT